MATHYYCLLTKEESEDPTKVGWAYALSKESEWVNGDPMGDFLAPGYNIGNDFIVNENKVYFIKKTFTDITNQRYVYWELNLQMGVTQKFFNSENIKLMRK